MVMLNHVQIVRTSNHRVLALQFPDGVMECGERKWHSITTVVLHHFDNIMVMDRRSIHGYSSPPEEIPLKLAEGFANANDVTSVYWKDQFNQVHFFIALLMPQITSTFGVVIATLPEGYRPNKTLLYVCSSMDVSTRRTGSFNVNPDGTIVYYGDLLSPGAILFGSGAFVAAG